MPIRDLGPTLNPFGILFENRNALLTSVCFPLQGIPVTPSGCDRCGPCPSIPQSRGNPTIGIHFRIDTVFTYRTEPENL
jgi:hypothetical protein